MADIAHFVTSAEVDRKISELRNQQRKYINNRIAQQNNDISNYASVAKQCELLTDGVVSISVNSAGRSISFNSVLSPSTSPVQIVPKDKSIANVRSIRFEDGSVVTGITENASGNDPTKAVSSACISGIGDRLDAVEDVNREQDEWINNYREWFSDLWRRNDIQEQRLDGHDQKDGEHDVKIGANESLILACQDKNSEQDYRIHELQADVEQLKNDVPTNAVLYDSPEVAYVPMFTIRNTAWVVDADGLSATSDFVVTCTDCVKYDNTFPKLEEGIDEWKIEVEFNILIGRLHRGTSNKGYISYTADNGYFVQGLAGTWSGEIINPRYTVETFEFTYKLCIPTAVKDRYGAMTDVENVTPEKWEVRSGAYPQQWTNGYTINDIVVANNIAWDNEKRLKAVESKSNSLDTRLTNAESVNTTQDTRLTTTETAITNHNTRLRDIETLNSTQDTRLTDLETAVNGIFDKIYPIGSIYISIDGTKPPFGSWTQLTTGIFLYNVAISVAGSRGGKSTHTHTTGDHKLTAAEMPAHIHEWTAPNNTLGNPDGQTDSSSKDHTGYRYWRGTPFVTAQTTFAGGNGAHNHGDTGTASNIPPYMGVVMWKRTG